MVNHIIPWRSLKLTTPLEFQLAEKITVHQELESEINDAKFRLDYTKYEINNLKDAIIEEYKEKLEEKQQQIESLQVSQG